jgi:phosphate transport system substrate-binding protein
MQEHNFSFNFAGFIFGLFLFLSCSQDKKKEYTDVEDMVIGTDETFLPIVQAQEYIFESLYKRTSVEIEHAVEGNIIKSFLHSKLQMMITGRKLDGKEIAFINSKKNSVHQTQIATDAIVFIINKYFPDSTLSLSMLKSILEGKITYWKEINPGLPKEKIRIVFDQSNSANLLALQSFANLAIDSSTVFAAGSVPKVFEYVRNNNYTLGVIGWSWISDEEDKKTQQYLQGLKVLGLGENGNFYFPGPSEVVDSLYPLTRGIYAINKGAKDGVETAFASFMASDRGQRIILKSGLIPAKAPGREIQLK